MAFNMSQISFQLSELFQSVLTQFFVLVAFISYQRDSKNLMKIICSRSLVLFPPNKTDYITKNSSDSYSNLIYCLLYLIYLIHSVLIVFSTENHLKRKCKVCNILYRFQPVTDLLPLFCRRLAQEHWDFKYALPQKILWS